MSKLVDHIKAENAKTQAWVDKDPQNRWAGFITDDPQHWADYGIYNVDQYEHYMAKMAVWEMYKEVNGIRPRWMNLDDMSIEELEAELESLCEEAREQDELADYWSEIREQEMELENEEYQEEMELAPNKYELLAEQAGY